MEYFVNYKFPGMADSFFQSRVNANNPDEALLIVQDKLAVQAADYKLANHPYPPIKMSDVIGIRFTYCGTNSFAQG